MFDSSEGLFVRRGVIIWLALVFLVSGAGVGQAAIYSYTDEEGHVHITDQPVDNKYKLLLTTLKRPKGFKSPVQTGRRYGDLVREYAQTLGLSHPLLLALIKTESNFNPRAVSPKGARGLMQLMPATWQRYGVTDPFDAAQNIRAGSNYLFEMLGRFQDVTLALAAYNAGPEAVEKYKGVPPFEETQRYIRKIYWYYDYYRHKSKLVTLPGVASYFDQGFEALQAGDLARAAASFTRVVKTFPNSPEANYNLALALERTGHLSRAVALYRKTLALNPYFKEAYYNLAIIFERQGQIPRAISTWRSYLGYEVRQDQIKEVKQYIKELQQLSRQ